MRRQPAHSDAETEGLVFRLFAEKQFAMALLALVMVANLLSAQFLLLRVHAPVAQATAAPSPADRVDVACEAGRLVLSGGGALDPIGLAGRKLVVHLDASTNACLVAATDAGVADVVVGLSGDPR